MSAVCFCASSLLSASDVGSSSTLIGYRGLASRVGALKVQFSELRALVRWARYCVYVRNYVQLPRLTPPTQRFNASTRVPRLNQWFPMQKCRFSTPLTRATRLVWPYHYGAATPNALRRLHASALVLRCCAKFTQSNSCSVLGCACCACCQAIYRQNSRWSNMWSKVFR